MKILDKYGGAGPLADKQRGRSAAQNLNSISPRIDKNIAPEVYNKDLKAKIKQKASKTGGPKASGRVNDYDEKDYKSPASKNKAVKSNLNSRQSTSGS